MRVAIIDTGADIRHADLRGSIAAAVNFVDSDDAQFLRDRHGTEMAGVIAAVANNREGIVGVAPNARLLIFKACWQAQPDADAARCNSFTLARALTAAFDAHVQVVNLSLAGPDDPLLGDLIREGEHRGVLFVGAAPEAPGVADGLLHQAGVIEVASAETHSVIDTALYAPGREILYVAPRRSLRLRLRRFHSNRPGERRGCANVGEESGALGGGGVSRVARHQFPVENRGRRDQGDRRMRGGGDARRSGFLPHERGRPPRR